MNTRTNMALVRSEKGPRELMSLSEEGEKFCGLVTEGDIAAPP